MNRKDRIYPKDWVGNMPYDQTTEADRYYADVATEVYHLLLTSFMYDEVFGTREKNRRAALCLTGLLEDILSGTGIWDLFVSECLRRYGRLPFYSMDDYVRGEINLQDVRLLLWDLAQSFRDKSVTNPENPYIEQLARSIYAVLDREYEYAPENTALKEFLTDPAIGEGYWPARKRMEWILHSCFINHRFMSELPGDLESILESNLTDSMDFDKMVYYHEVDRLFNFRSNLLSMRCGEILSGVCGCDPNGVLAKMRLLPMLNYIYLGIENEQLKLQRAADDKLLCVEMDSFNQFDSSNLIAGRSVLTCQLANYGDKWYQAGIMGVMPGGTKITEEMKLNELQVLPHTVPPEAEKTFRNAMKGRSIAMFSSFDEMRDFIENISGKPMSLELAEDFPRDKVYMVTFHPAKGLCITAALNHCICLPDNTFYDKRRAEADALAFYSVPDVCAYEVSCYLQDNNLLPDARLNSIHGPEHGRALLHHNGRFMTDYFFHRYRGDESL